MGDESSSHYASRYNNKYTYISILPPLEAASVAASAIYVFELNVYVVGSKIVCAAAPHLAFMLNRDDHKRATTVCDGNNECSFVATPAAFSSLYLRLSFSDRSNERQE